MFYISSNLIIVISFISTFNNQLGRGVNIGATFEQETDYPWSDGIKSFIRRECVFYYETHILCIVILLLMQSPH